MTSEVGDEGESTATMETTAASSHGDVSVPKNQIMAKVGKSFEGFVLY